MAEFVVHSVPGSPYGRAVMATLEEKGVPWRLEPVRPGTFKQPEHLARHPFGRVPVLDHGDFSLYETQAILRYLDRVLPTPALTPADPRVAAQMDRVMGVNDCYLFNGVANVIVFQRLVAPRVYGTPPDLAAIEAAMPRGRIVIDELARLLGDRPFMAGDSLSLADLHTAPQLAMMAVIPEWATLGAHHENLVTWLARMQSRPSFSATTWERLTDLAKAA